MEFLYQLRFGLWSFGISGFVFGLSDRTIATLADGYPGAIDLMQLFTAGFFFFCWLVLKPELRKVEVKSVDSTRSEK